jgi:hypothetical protein
MEAKQDRKAAIREYKEHKVERGIFALRCAATGRVWVELAPNLGSAGNAELFQLRLGAHRNPELQAEWNAQGEAAFTFEVLERLDEDVAPAAVKDLLKERKAHWMAALGAGRVSPR